MVHANYFCHVALFVLVVILLPYFPSSACSPQKNITAGVAALACCENSGSINRVVCRCGVVRLFAASVICRTIEQ